MAFLQRKYLTLIHNPTAGPTRVKKLSSLIAALESRGGNVKALQTRGVGHATELARDAIEDCDVVVAVGGDGTLAEVIGGIAGSEQLMGLIPLGTANSAAIDMGLASRLHVRWPLVVETLLSGASHPVYVGRLSDREKSKYFIMMVGVGFDAQIVGYIDLNVKKRWGKWAYARTGLATLTSYRPKELLVNDTQTNWVIAANGQHYGGPFKVSKQADLLAPGIVVLAMRLPTRWHVLRALWDLARGALEQQDYVQCLIGRRFEISSRNDGYVPIQMDGDYFGQAPVLIEAVEKPVSFLLPKTISSRADKKK